MWRSPLAAASQPTSTKPGSICAISTTDASFGRIVFEPSSTSIACVVLERPLTRTVSSPFGTSTGNSTVSRTEPSSGMTTSPRSVTPPGFRAGKATRFRPPPGSSMRSSQAATGRLAKSSVARSAAMGRVLKNRDSWSSGAGSVRDTRASQRSGGLSVRALRIRAFTRAARFNAEAAFVKVGAPAATREKAGAKPGTRIAASHSPAETTKRTPALPFLTSTGASKAGACSQVVASAALTTISARLARSGPDSGQRTSVSSLGK